MNFKLNIFLRIIGIVLFATSCIPLDLNGRDEVPILKYESDFGNILNHSADFNTLFLDNKNDLNISVKCSGHKPTEIILDLDIDVYEEAALAKLAQWSDHTIEGNATVYNAFTKLGLAKSGLPRNETWYCRYVGSNRAVTLDLTLSSDQKSVQARKRERDVSTELVESNESSCDVHIHFYEDVEEDEVYFRCEGDGHSEFSKSDTFDCLTSQMCASVFRTVQKKTCFTVESEKTGSGEWFNPTLIRPGVFVCWSDGQRGAVQYFFSGTGRGKGTRRTHLSWSEVEPKNLLSLMLDKEDEYGEKTYYNLNEVISAFCGVPRYGFSYTPFIAVYLNGTMIKQEMGDKQRRWLERIWYIQAKVNVTMPGVYQINCTAPLWNSTEFAIESRTVVVRGISSNDLRSSSVLSITSPLGSISNGSFYIGDTVNVQCLFPGSGLGPNPELIISANKTVIDKVTDFEHDNTTRRSRGREQLPRMAIREFGSDRFNQSLGVLRKNEKYTFETSGQIGFECRIPILEGSKWVDYKERQEITVKRSRPPFFRVAEEVVQVRVGESCVMHCEAEGDPMPVTDWEQQRYGPSVLANGPNLTITYVGELTRGIYVCTARNRFGETAQKNFKLEIKSGASTSIIISAWAKIISYLI